MSARLWKGKADVASNLRSRLPRQVREWFAEGDLALQGEQPYEEIHRFRLLTKRFRYTLEIFRPAYGPSLDRIIEELRGLQTLLGDLNDCVASSHLLTDVPGSDAARIRLDRKATRKASELRALWARDYASAARRGQWERYLVRYACRAGQQGPRPRPQAEQLPAATPEASSAEAITGPQDTTLYTGE